MRYKVTNRTEALVAELAILAEGAKDRLALASAEAQREWEVFRVRWPSEIELRKGIIALSDDELSFMRSKVERFVSILGAMESARSSNAEIRTVGRRVVSNFRIDLMPSGERSGVPDDVDGLLPQEA
jgi:hypothetical protein